MTSQIAFTIGIICLMVVFLMVGCSRSTDNPTGQDEPVPERAAFIDDLDITKYESQIITAGISFVVALLTTLLTHFLGNFKLRYTEKLKSYIRPFKNEI